MSNQDAISTCASSPAGNDHDKNGSLSEEGQRLVDAVGKNGRALKWASAALRGNRSVVIAAVQRNWESLEWVPDEFSADRDIVAAAV